MPEQLYEQTYHADGSMTERLVVEDGSLLESEVEARVSERLGEEKLSRAQRRRLLREKDTEGVEHVRTVEIGQEKWFLQRLSFPKLSLALTLSGRDNNAILDLSLEDEEALSAYITGIFRVVLVVSPSDRTPYFESLAEAREFVDDDDEAEAVARLFMEAADFVPEACPGFEDVAQKVLPALRAMGSASVPKTASSISQQNSPSAP